MLLSTNSSSSLCCGPARGVLSHLIGCPVAEPSGCLLPLPSRASLSHEPRRLLSHSLSRAGRSDGAELPFLSANLSGVALALSLNGPPGRCQCPVGVPAYFLTPNLGTAPVLSHIFFIHLCIIYQALSRWGFSLKFNILHQRRS